jgi:acyl-CoA reductase-like NAD-dependent aldehyde dehydrogenase
VLADVRRNMRVMQEETFGPVAPIAAFDTLEEGVRMANDTPYGLAAYVYTSDVDQAFYASQHLRAGGVGINVNDVTDIRGPFGGMKMSGIGRELGQPGLDSYLEVKHVRFRYRSPR